MIFDLYSRLIINYISNTVNLIYDIVEISWYSCCFNFIDQFITLIIYFSPGFKVSITLLDEFKKTSP